MRVFVVMGTAALLAAQTFSVRAADVESGLKLGDAVGAFQVVKKGGIDDGVEVDKALCYR